MFCIENSDITMTKGDSGFFLVRLENADGSEFVPNEKDEVIFCVKRKKEKYCPVVLAKKGTKIVFEKEDTEKIPSGEYVYDIVVEKNTGERCTAVEGKFVVRKAVHEF